MATALLVGGAVLGGVGSIVGGINSYSAGKANARVFETEAVNTRALRNFQKIQDERDFREFQGSNMVVSGGSGFAAEFTDADFADIEDFVRDQVLLDWEAESRAVNFENQAKISKNKASGDLFGGIVSGLSSFALAGSAAAGGAKTSLGGVGNQGIAGGGPSSNLQF